MISALLEFMALCLSVIASSYWSHHTDASLTHPLGFVFCRLKMIFPFLLRICFYFGTSSRVFIFMTARKPSIRCKVLNFL